MKISWRTAAIVFVAFLAIVVVQVRPDRTPNHSLREQALARSRPALDEARRDIERSIDASCAPVRRLFDEARRNSPEFAADVLGLGSKFRFVADRVPGARGDRHEEFLKAAFARRLFSEDDLVRALEQSCTGFAARIEAAENRMLVRLQADLGDLPAGTIPGFDRPEQTPESFSRAIDAAMGRVGAEVRADVATLLVSFVAQEFAAQGLVRLGVSAGVLSAGAGASWGTFGLSLVAGVIVDQLITVAWDWWADPRGELSAEMNRKLTELERILLDGQDDQLGLRGRLRAFALERDRIRRRALAAMLLGDEQAATAIVEQLPAPPPGSDASPPRIAPRSSASLPVPLRPASPRPVRLAGAS
jgi:hypothetical protein